MKPHTRSRPTPASLLATLGQRGIRLGLDPMRSLLAALDNPERAFPAVLIGGTNGKGSCAAFLSSMATAAGYRTGLYTSPHLENPRERIRIDGRCVSAAQLATALEQVLAVAGRAGIAPTYFEAMTAAALSCFRDAGVRLGVLEVGLGGRLDATNAVSPVLSVVTGIDIDHADLLGSTLEQIAREKAGIFRRGRPALVAAGIEHAAHRELLRVAGQLGAEIELVAASAELRPESATGDQLLDVLPEPERLSNLACAVAAARRLAALSLPRIGDEAIVRGAAATRWPGRLESVTLPGGHKALLDGAHNPGGARALARHLANRGESFTLLFGVLDDKEPAAMLPPLAALAAGIVLTRPPSARALDPRQLALHAPAGCSTSIEPDPLRALDRALSAGRPVVIAGSLYLVGRLRCRMRRRWGTPVAAVALSTFDPPAGGR